VRLRALLSQEQLAEQARVSRQTLIRAEAGEPVTASTIRKLARGLRVTPESLMGPPSGPVEMIATPLGRPPAKPKPRGRPSRAA